MVSEQPSFVSPNSGIADRINEHNDWFDSRVNNLFTNLTNPQKVFLQHLYGDKGESFGELVDISQFSGESVYRWVRQINRELLFFGPEVDLSVYIVSYYKEAVFSFTQEPEERLIFSKDRFALNQILSSRYGSQYKKYRKYFEVLLSGMIREEDQVIDMQITSSSREVFWQILAGDLYGSNKDIGRLAQLRNDLKKNNLGSPLKLGVGLEGGWNSNYVFKEIRD